MKFGAILLLTTVPVFGADITGKWKAVFTDPPMERPKTVSEMTFDLKAEGNELTGTAFVGNWPGKGPLIDGKINGNRIAFTVSVTCLGSPKVPSLRKAGFPSLSSPEPSKTGRCD